jgi:hypothetical protein
LTNHRNHKGGITIQYLKGYYTGGKIRKDLKRRGIKKKRKGVRGIKRRIIILLNFLLKKMN